MAEAEWRAVVLKDCLEVVVSGSCREEDMAVVGGKGRDPRRALLFSLEMAWKRLVFVSHRKFRAN